MSRGALLVFGILAVGLGACGGGGAAPVQATAFVVHEPGPSFVAPRIVIHHDPTLGVGFDWAAARDRATVGNRKVFQRDDEMFAWGAAAYLEEGIRKLTGRSLEITSGPDIDEGIVLLTWDGAPPEIRGDSTIAEALRDTGVDAYNAVEAYALRTSPARVLIVANRPAGWLDGVVELLESVDYEILGMGPRWIHAPDRSAGLAFDLQTSGRPSWYLRNPFATSGQYYGVGTVYDEARTPLVDDADEPVDVSYWRWHVGNRTWASCMPSFPGHALQARHADVLDAMRSAGSTQGFLAPTSLGLAADRPAPAVAGAGHLWVNTDASGTPDHGAVLLSSGTTWTAYDPALLPVSLDLTVELVRQVLLDDLVARAEAWFATHPDELYIHGTDPEDGGGYALFADRAADPTWYADYRAASGDPLGAPYPLHGQFGLDQPLEAFDPTSVADCVYAANDWLLREYDAWLAAQPPSSRVTSTGRAKADSVRLSFYSYNFHDVPPSFVPDPRMRVMIAGYPKNRGRGRWKELATPGDVAEALAVLLPREPSAVYGIWSLAYYQDFGVGGITPLRSNQAAALHPSFADWHASGVRGWSCEMDFNFGKHALTYYLVPRLLWDAALDVDAVDALRDRWLQRSFGSGWIAMKAYMDLMTPEAWFANTETLWAQAVAWIDAADAAIDPGLEPHAQARLDDVKQLWWWHYLQVEGRASASDTEVVTYLWKGQMSYQVAMHVLARRVFGGTFLHDVLDPAVFAKAAHYTAVETQAWWSQVQAAWQQVPVTLFADGQLADGSPASAVDGNDLVWTDDLVAAGARVGKPEDLTFWFNAGYQDPLSILMTAEPGEAIGFSLGWTEDVDRSPSVGVERWDAIARTWEQLVDPTTTSVDPVRGAIAFPATQGWVAHFTMAAPQAGTYRVTAGYGGNFAQGTGPGFDFAAYAHEALRPCTWHQRQQGLTQYAAAPNAFVYLPRGVSSLDMELLNDNGGTLRLYTRGVVTGEAWTSRDVPLGPRGTQVVPLQPGEDGGLAAFTLVGFEFPVLYSVPRLWARSPAALLVPRRVAEADGLTAR